MKDQTVDARGLPCPQPLILTKQALMSLAKGQSLSILIDNKLSCDNVSRFLQDHGMTPVLSSEAGVYTLVVEKEDDALPLGNAAAYCTPGGPAKGPVVVINHHGMGSGSEDLGKILLQACVNTLKDISPQPTAIICYNAGVFVAEKSSPCIPALTELVEQGITLLVCGTCIDYFELQDRIAVGTISNMYDILQQLATAERVITL